MSHAIQVDSLRSKPIDIPHAIPVSPDDQPAHTSRALLPSSGGGVVSHRCTWPNEHSALAILGCVVCPVRDFQRGGVDFVFFLCVDGSFFESFPLATLKDKQETKGSRRGDKGSPGPLTCERMDAILFFQRFTAVFVHCPERRRCSRGLSGPSWRFRSSPDPLRILFVAPLGPLCTFGRLCGGGPGAVGGLLGRLSWRSLRGLLRGFSDTLSKSL